MEPECQHLDDGEFLGRTFIFCWEGVLLGALRRVFVSGIPFRLISQDSRRRYPSTVAIVKDIPRYLDYLDRVVSAAPALYRKIYSQRCDTFNFDKKRKHLLRALDTWKGELDKWEHPLVKSWGSIFLPLRKLLVG